MFLQSSLGCDCFSGFSCFDDLDNLEGCWLEILQNAPHPLVLADVFLMVRLNLVGGLEEEDHRGKVPFSSHDMKGTHYQLSLSQLMLALVTRLK